MDKSDRDHALQLLDMASKDHTALANMLDPESFSEEVFGFHAQQTVEKTLKAWIAFLGRQYPKSHDISSLVTILREAKADLDGFPKLEDYTVFAVQYRYEAFDAADEPLDRKSVLNETAALMSRVRDNIAVSD
jgi:HEPN domain-containing protein